MTGTEDTWTAYAEAILYLQTPSGTLRVRPAPSGCTTGPFPGPPGQDIHVITAHNPSGTVRAAAANAAAQADLEAELTRRGRVWWRAAGGDPAWRHVEASAAVVGLDRGSAMALGRQFGQDAIFELAPAYRTVVDCTSGRTVTSGWTIDAIDDGHPEAGRALDDRQPSEPVPATDQTLTALKATGGMDQQGMLTPYPAGWLGQDGYLARLAQREGRLMSLTADGVALELHGAGDGTVSITWSGKETSASCAPAEAMKVLHEQGALDWDTDYTSGSWNPGEIAALVSPWLDLGGAGEFYVDEILMGTDGHGHAVPSNPGQAQSLTLSENHWELDGDGDSPANADHGWDYLLRIGPRYVFVQCADGEQEIDEVDASTDEEAIERFKSLIA